jgi:hypothetical protein
MNPCTSRSSLSRLAMRSSAVRCLPSPLGRARRACKETFHRFCLLSCGGFYRFDPFTITKKPFFQAGDALLCGAVLAVALGPGKEGLQEVLPVLSFIFQGKEATSLCLIGEKATEPLFRLARTLLQCGACRRPAARQEGRGN